MSPISAQHLILEDMNTYPKSTNLINRRSLMAKIDGMVVDLIELEKVQKVECIKILN